MATPPGTRSRARRVDRAARPTSPFGLRRPLSGAVPSRAPLTRIAGASWKSNPRVRGTGHRRFRWRRCCIPGTRPATFDPRPRSAPTAGRRDAGSCCVGLGRRPAQRIHLRHPRRLAPGLRFSGLPREGRGAKGLVLAALGDALAKLSRGFAGPHHEALSLDSPPLTAAAWPRSHSELLKQAEVVPLGPNLSHLAVLEASQSSGLGRHPVALMLSSPLMPARTIASSGLGTLQVTLVVRRGRCG
jgi:hypothetical protein